MIYTVSSHFFKKDNLSRFVSCVFVLSFVFLQLTTFKFESSPIQSEIEDSFEINLELDDSDDNDDSNTLSPLSFNLNHLTRFNVSDSIKTTVLPILSVQYSSRAPPKIYRF